MVNKIKIFIAISFCAILVNDVVSCIAYSIDIYLDIYLLDIYLDLKKSLILIIVTHIRLDYSNLVSAIINMKDFLHTCLKKTLYNSLHKSLFYLKKLRFFL